MKRVFGHRSVLVSGISIDANVLPQLLFCSTFKVPDVRILVK